jgi:indolepyruvate ferredoxin oxidoreductase
MSPALTIRLADKYTQESGRVYLTGIQALVRLPIDQMRRDRAAGLNTGTFISGYEGSPLGGYDLALARTRKLLDQYNIHFVPGVNEELAATSVLGSQIFDVAGKSKVDGVVGFWYGKGPGVDRSGDIFRHANLAGTGKNCGAVVLFGDDHTAKSSTVPHQSDFSLYNYGLPFFYPGNTQEILDYGILAVALSRYSGAWTGLKLVTDICDGGGTVDLDPGRPAISLPEGYEKHTDARIVSPITLGLEYETYVRRLEAARQFARLNQVNRIHGSGKIGLLSAGKSYYDMMQALHDLGIHDGVRIGQVAMPFPLDPAFIAEFAEGLDRIIVVEEKRSFLELQAREILYSLPHRPELFGKSHFPPTGDLDPDRIALVLSKLLNVTASRLIALAPASPKSREPLPTRASAFCSGCPHNRSTLLLEGQLAGGGIGCHTMAMRLGDPSRNVKFITQMGGEGAPWIGMSPFVEQGHVFQNIGDGTFFHSGSLAVEACVAAGVNITYKILYNGHVAMTGGQIAAGALTVPQLTRKLQAEGVKKTVVLAEEPEKYKDLSEFAPNSELLARSELHATLARLEKIEGVTVIIYDQECAAEKRRQRSRGTLKEPTLRLVINEDVCEGCGDCVKQSNCMSLQPVATEKGQKIRIHQSSCNKDYSCALGDCPSFVSIQIKPGTGLKKKSLPQLPAAEVAPPRDRVQAGAGYRIIAPGIGGTGVVTINALLATAAWIDGLNVATLDQTGTAQKGGAVVSHLLLSEAPIIGPAKVNTANADLILGFDLLGIVSPENLKTASADRTVAVINTDLVPTIDDIRSRTPISGPGRMLEIVNATTIRGRNLIVDGNRLAEGLFGTHLSANIFLTGLAYQGGLIPLSADSIDQAIALNGVEAEKNRLAFLWGRKYYTDPAWVEEQLRPKAAATEKQLDRVAELCAYQDAKYSKEYSDFLAKIDHPQLREVVAKYLFKLMTYKDEYEVARLLTDPAFEERARAMWEAPEGISYNLHPPLLRGLGFKNKLKLGAWFRTPLRMLQSLKSLRGGPLDLFGYSAHRRQERELITWYRAVIEKVLAVLSPENLTQALEIAALPDRIRGYEQIKEGSIAEVKKEAEERLSALHRPAAIPVRS